MEGATDFNNTNNTNKMKNMKKTLMAMMVAYTTQAATVVHTVTINPTLTDWSVTNRVPQFDARLGKLRSVQVTVDAEAAGQSQFVNLDRGWRIPVDLAVTNSVSVRVGTLAAGESVASVSRYVPVFGATNVTPFSVSLSGASSTNRNLGGWIGTNTVPVVTRASARTWYSGPGDYSLAWRTAASAVATVAYTFDGRCDEDNDKDSDKDKDKDGR
jgi:hypothetical protein